MSKVPFVERYRWRRVEAPKPWQPTNFGDELAGFYAGKTKLDGSLGQYDVVLVAVPGRGLFYVSGVRVIQLVDAGAFVRTDPILIRFAGRKETTLGRQMKLFDVFKAAGENIAEEDLPIADT